MKYIFNNTIKRNTHCSWKKMQRKRGATREASATCPLSINTIDENIHRTINLMTLLQYVNQIHKAETNEISVALKLKLN